ncbi:hypothetical protein AGMMS50212_14720 [Spirochaetia bacterium]|nr:hypothetical protein AGMMS50212_14670 [Spirochaetia bacterium]GHV84132.1 hypothetical protein AGMMS50212_14720 [Spirochaetia bacterium]
MKGVIVQIGKKKSVVMFNNGNIRTIPNLPNSQMGMVIDVSYNKRKLIFWAVLAFILLVCFPFAAIEAYSVRAGYIQIINGENEQTNASIELTYNYFKRVISFCPLNDFAVTPLAGMELRFKSITGAYQNIIETFGNSEFPLSQHTVVVRIAEDNLVNAKEIEQSLGAIPGNLGLTIKFELYTIALYRKVLEESGALEFSALGKHDDDDEDDDD